MEETKIKGLKIIFTEDSMKIQDSYQISNVKKMKDILEEALNKTTLYQTKRSINSLLREWIVHNLLYKLHIKRKHTKDSDFEKRIKKIIAFNYFLLASPFKIKYNYLKVSQKIKIKKKENKYKKYLKKHQKNIKKAYYNEIANNPNIFLLIDKEILDKLYKRILNHDKSKYSKEEFDAYRKNFFPINKKEKEENLKNFEKAVEHHYKNNPHHWQNRQYKEKFDITNDEEIVDVLENVLDWVSVGYEFKNTAKEYYDKNKNNIILNSKEKVYLEHIIYDILLNKGAEKWKNKKRKKLR